MLNQLNGQTLLIEFLTKMEDVSIDGMNIDQEKKTKIE